MDPSDSGIRSRLRSHAEASHQAGFYGDLFAFPERLRSGFYLDPDLIVLEKKDHALFFTAANLFDFTDERLDAFPVEQAITVIANILLILCTCGRSIFGRNRHTVVIRGTFLFELAVKTFQPFVGFFDIGTVVFRCMY